MITGFNTDVEHEGVTYHVQTEDKGLKSPLILSLVYVGGTILASKRTPYEDLLASEFDEGKLAERLQRQHRLICAAIHAGRIEDLKRQTERESVYRSKQAEVEQEQVEPEQEEKVETPQVAKEDPDIIQMGSLADHMPPPAPWQPPPPPTEIKEEPPAPAFEHVDYSRVVDYSEIAAGSAELQISLLDEKKFIAGEFVKIRLHVRRGDFGEESIADAAVTLKILGSSFRPMIFNAKTGSDGIAIFYAMLPYYTSGRAAILASVVVMGEKAELRRVIHQVGI